MEILIKQAEIIDSRSSYNGQIKDVLILNGKVSKIEENIEAPEAVMISLKGLQLSPGWIDLYADFQDPGFEQKEDIESGLSAAAAGGFTAVCVASTTQPERDSKGQVEYLLNRSKSHLVSCLPYACVSKEAKGKELAEFYDLHKAGAVAYSDSKRSIQNPNLLKNALLYAKSFDGLVVNFPHTAEMAAKGVMNEGKVSTALGLNGMPELAESLMVERDIHINEYVGGKLHFNTISAAQSIDLIKNAKENEQNVSCDVASYQLLLDDTNLNEFDTRFKTLPPLRSKETIERLIEGIKSGTIDAISSNHIPEDIEAKKKEMDHAAFGIINLQTAFAAAWTALEGKVTLTRLIDLLTYGPSKVLGIDKQSVEEGAIADFTLFASSQDFTLKEEMVTSKSFNSPFMNKSLKGKVVGVIKEQQMLLNEPIQ